MMPREVQNVLREFREGVVPQLESIREGFMEEVALL